MKLMNERNQVRDVAGRWREQYGRYTDERKTSITHKLDKLDGEIASADDVAAIIGNTSWVEPKTCDECGTTTWSIVQIGEEPDYESDTSLICGDCLSKALALLGSESDPVKPTPVQEPVGGLDDATRIGWAVWRIKDLEQQLASRPTYTVAQQPAPVHAHKLLYPGGGDELFKKLWHLTLNAVATQSGMRVRTDVLPMCEMREFLEHLCVMVDSPPAQQPASVQEPVVTLCVTHKADNIILRYTHDAAALKLPEGNYPLYMTPQSSQKM